MKQLALEIRDAVQADLPALLAIYNDAVLNTTAVWDETPRTPAQQAEWFAPNAHKSIQCWWRRAVVS